MIIPGLAYINVEVSCTDCRLAWTHRVDDTMSIEEACDSVVDLACPHCTRTPVEGDPPLGDMSKMNIEYRPDPPLGNLGDLQC